MSLSLNFGENGTLQHSWNLEQWQNTLTQFYFQLVRNCFDTDRDLSLLFVRLLDQSKTDTELQTYLFRLVVHTRDI